MTSASAMKPTTHPGGTLGVTGPVCTSLHFDIATAAAVLHTSDALLSAATAALLQVLLPPVLLCFPMFRGCRRISQVDDSSDNCAACIKT